MAMPVPEEHEIRTCLVNNDGAIEVRAVSATTDQPGFDGYVSTWWTVDDRGTCFAPGGFKKTFRERMKIAPILWNHDYFDGLPIGKHLGAEEDARGARIKAAINEGIQRGAEVMSNMRFGTPTGLSFGFDRMADRTATDKDPLDFSVAPEYIKSWPRNEIRVITETRYWEGSPTTFASNPKAKHTDVRSALAALIDAEDFPKFLHDLRTGQLPDELLARVNQIVAAEQERAAAAGQNHGTGEIAAPRNLDVEYEFIFGGVFA